MSVITHISDIESGLPASVLQRDGTNRIQVLTEPYRKFTNKSTFFVNEFYGSNMNINGSDVDTIENIHNGEDDTYWTATTIVGNAADFDFSSTDVAHTGTQSIDCTNSEGGDTFQLANDTFLSSGFYDLFVGWIYITGLWGLPDDGLEIILYNTDAGVQVSENSVDLDDYIDGDNTGVWQQFSIPMSDFGVVSDDFDAMRFTILEDGDPPNFYLDDLQLQALAGESAIFSIEPPTGVWWHVYGIGIVIVSSYTSTLADSSMPNIPYNGLLGTEMTNGITYQRKEEGEVQFSINVNHLIEILNHFNTSITSQGYDGNYTWIKIDAEFNPPFVLKSELEDYIRFIINDNLAGLEYFKASAALGEENRKSIY